MASSRRIAVKLYPRFRAIATGLIVGVWGYYLAGQWAALREHSWTLSVGPLLAGFGFAVGCWVLMSLGWWQALRAVGGRLDPIAAFRVWITSINWRYLPGTVWYFLGRVYLGGHAGESRVTVAASSALEQIVLLAGACLVILPCLVGWSAGRWLAAPAALGLAGGLLILQPAAARLAGRSLARWTKIDPGPMAPSPGRLCRSLGLFVAAHLSAGLSVWALAAAVGSPTDPVPLIGGAVTSWVIGYLSVLTPSGLGVREGLLIVFLAPLIGAPSALLVSVLSRAMLMLAEAVLWSVATFWRP